MGLVTLMVWNKCGGQKAAEHDAGRVRVMVNQIPRSTVQDVRRDDGDMQLQQSASEVAGVKGLLLVEPHRQDQQRRGCSTAGIQFA